MRLKTVRVQNYRSIRDTGDFEIEDAKTILVGPNEAGKTAILQALQQINAPKGTKGFDPLRDYPRSLYNDISTGKADPEDIPVATATFALDDADREAIPERFRDVAYQYTRYLDNHATHTLIGGPAFPTYGEIKNDLLRLAAHIDGRTAVAEGDAPSRAQSLAMAAITEGWADSRRLSSEATANLKQWVDGAVVLIDEANEAEEARLSRLQTALSFGLNRDAALQALAKRKPVFVLYSNYFRVRPVIHLNHLADRLDAKNLDDDHYDYGNSCLLKLLGFTARELSNLGAGSNPEQNQPNQLEAYRARLDKRTYQLNAASIRLTDEIRSVWKPSDTRPEADRLRVQADGQYLKVVVEDELGVEVELHQRSEGFQWLVSFFVVFFAEAADQNENAILLLDEPGVSLHALKQREFRHTVSRLAEHNQTIYTTHSPFLVGPDELDLVRVVELNDRRVGTQVHTSVTSTDKAALLPLQEALGYDLAQSLFAQERNLVLEGLTDYWYLEAVSGLLANGAGPKLNDKIALVPAGSAGKLVYFATILHAQKLKVAALLDSDAAGDQAAQQDSLVHILGSKAILRTRDYVSGVGKAEIEDLLRDTLPALARDVLGIDVTADVASQPSRPVLDILAKADRNFSKYKLAKAFLRWARDNDAQALSESERAGWASLVTAINSALK
jgi:energy-coupling factor transporter ATP-binding protein EcfA2